jgi:hypothetical protein
MKLGRWKDPCSRENSFPSVGKENDAQILQRREEEMVF